VARLTGTLAATINARGARVQAKAPLELRGPFSGSAYFLRNTTAGVFGGDAYEVEVTASSGCAVRVSGSSATKVYVGSEGESSLDVRLTVEPGATLVWGPHATIVQGGARYRQATLLSGAVGGRAVLGEVLALGRPARGELFDFNRLESRLDVNLAGASVYSEAYVLQPGPDLVASMAGRGVLASVYGIGFDAAEGDRLDCLLAKNEQPAGWSLLPNHAGVVVRCLSGSLSQAQSLVEAVTDRLLCC
jgi:urease accessory protein